MTQRFQVNRERINPRPISMASDILRHGGTLAYPTDTSYALGCSIFEKKAIDKVYLYRELPKNHRLSFLCQDLKDISKYAWVEDHAYRVMKRLVPGPYTFLLRATREVPKLLLRKRKKVGIRVPNHPVTQMLLEHLQAPILTSTAKYRDNVLNDPDEIIQQFPSIDGIVDVGVELFGPSTVIDLSEGKIEIVREGIGDVSVI